MPTTFNVPPTPSLTILYVAVFTPLILILALLITGRGYALIRRLLWKFVAPKLGERTYRVVSLGAVLVALAIVGGLAIPGYFAHITFHDDVLEVNAPPFAHVLISKEDVVRAFIVDWRTERPYRPVLRTGGTSFGDYNAGWFKLANGASALLLSTGPINLVCETRLGFYVILRPYNFEEFLEAFKAFHEVSEKP